MTELLRRTIGSHVTLNAILPDGTWPVKMDPGHLEQVVINLAVNSRDAMPEGRQALDLGRERRGRRSVRSGPPELVPGRYVQLQVSDTGSGMDKATLDRIFEPFFTAKPVGHGTGLGLATVTTDRQQVGGHASVGFGGRSRTTITVLIPATDAPAPAGSSFRPRSSDPARAPARCSWSRTMKICAT